MVHKDTPGTRPGVCLSDTFIGPKPNQLMAPHEVNQAARYDPGDKVFLPNDPGMVPPWTITRVYWSDTKGIVYDLECGQIQRIAVPEDRMHLVEGWAKLF